MTKYRHNCKMNKQHYNKMQVEEIKDNAIKYDQGHLFDHWKTLSPSEQQELITDIQVNSTTFSKITRQYLKFRKLILMY